ncbi:MAG: hypothetical protein KDA85_02935, partial [Planctomycetaceae bacterium]|nr:hypothetical protein [Planctomycetaceae bacterium]
MTLFGRIRWLLLLATVVSCQMAPLHALPWHPVSHTDVWIRVADDLDVRVIVFLDDVVRFADSERQAASSSDAEIAANDSGNGTPANDRVSAEHLQQLIAAHATHLQRQIQFYDEAGQALVLELLELPDISDLGAAIDLQANANLRLTWRFRMTPAHPLQFLTVLPQLWHPELTSVPELRLHLVQTDSGRRLDAVVPDGRPHLIRLPNGKTARSFADEPKDVDSSIANLNVPVCDITVLRGRTVVELMTPLMA